MFTQAPSVRLCSVLVAIGLAVGSAGFGQTQSPTRPALLSGAETYAGQVVASTNNADATLPVYSPSCALLISSVASVRARIPMELLC